MRRKAEEIVKEKRDGGNQVWFQRDSVVEISRMKKELNVIQIRIRPKTNDEKFVYEVVMEIYNSLKRQWYLVLFLLPIYDVYMKGGEM